MLAHSETQSDLDIHKHSLPERTKHIHTRRVWEYNADSERGTQMVQKLYTHKTKRKNKIARTQICTPPGCVGKKNKRMLIISQKNKTSTQTHNRKEGTQTICLLLPLSLQITHLRWALWVNTAFIYLFSFSLYSSLFSSCLSLPPISSLSLSLSGGCGLCIHLLLTVCMCWVLMFKAKGCCALSEVKLIRCLRLNSACHVRSDLHRQCINFGVT